MPYLKSQDKSKFERALEILPVPESAGEINYIVTEIIKGYIGSKGLSYQTCNDIVGALDNCKDEFKRRVQNSYEDFKISQNGDVYNVPPPDTQNKQ